MTNLEYPQSTFALRLRDDSNAPQYQPDDIVVINPAVQPKIPARVASLVCDQPRRFLWRIETDRWTASWDTYIKLAGSLGIPVESLLVSRSNVDDAPRDWREIPVLDLGTGRLYTF